MENSFPFRTYKAPKNILGVTALKQQIIVLCTK